MPSDPISSSSEVPRPRRREIESHKEADYEDWRPRGCGNAMVDSGITSTGQFEIN